MPTVLLGNRQGSTYGDWVPRPDPDAPPSPYVIWPTEPVVEQHTVEVTIGPDGQMIATEDSRPALIRVHGESVEEIPQLPPAPSEES